MKKYCAFLLLFCLLCISGTALAQDDVAPDDGGTCGTNVRYQIMGITIYFDKDDPDQAATWADDCLSPFKNNEAISIVNIADEPIKFANGSKFQDAKYIQEMNLSKLDVSESDVTDMSGMFSDLSSLNSLEGLSSWNTSSVTDMGGMFSSCEKLTSLDLSGWDTSKVADMSNMFNACSALTSLDLRGWDTSNVTNMSSMFNYCILLTSLEGLGSWNTSKVTNMYEQHVLLL